MSVNRQKTATRNSITSSSKLLLAAIKETTAMMLSELILQRTSKTAKQLVHHLKYGYKFVLLPEILLKIVGLVIAWICFNFREQVSGIRTEWEEVLRHLVW